jgi:hypothetical protein
MAAAPIEAAQERNNADFVDGRAAHELVFAGAKWQTRWALVLGRRQTPELTRRTEAVLANGLHRPVRR